MRADKPVSPAATIWDDSQEQRKPGWIHLGVFLLLVIGGMILGAFSSLSFKITEYLNSSSPAYGVNYFWLGIVVQQVGSIWYGGWGVIAGILFPIFSNTVTRASILVSVAYIPANFIQSLLPAYVFRKLKLNPELKSGRDYFYLFLSMIASNLLGAVWSVFILVVVLGRLDSSAALTAFYGWFGGNLVAGIIFNFAVLKAVSGAVIKSRAFVRNWWV